MFIVLFCVVFTVVLVLRFQSVSMSFTSVLRCSTFSFLSNLFIIVPWNILWCSFWNPHQIMPTSVLFPFWHLLSFIIKVKIFLVLDIIRISLIAGSWWNSWLLAGPRWWWVLLFAEWGGESQGSHSTYSDISSICPIPWWNYPCFPSFQIFSLPYLPNPQIFLLFYYFFIHLT